MADERCYACGARYRWGEGGVILALCAECQATAEDIAPADAGWWPLVQRTALPALGVVALMRFGEAGHQWLWLLAMFTLVASTVAQGLRLRRLGDRIAEERGVPRFYFTGDNDG